MNSKITHIKGFAKSVIAGIIFAGLFSGAIYVFATPPGSQYAPGETLNPSCAVGSTNCSVTYPVPYTGATAAVDLGAQNFLTTGTGGFGALSATATSGAQQTLKYDVSNYATLTTASNGDLSIATTSGSGGGNININSAITGDFTFLSNSGTLVLGGTANTNNENLKLDFETYANKVAVTSTTGVTDLDLGSLNLTTTGILTLGGSTTGTLVTRVKAGAASESDTNGSLVVDSSNGRLYFRYGGAWHYVAQTAGFQIPDFETIDPLSGDEIKEGDFVLGMVNQTFSDKALHGVWVKWDSVKADLIKELKGEVNINSIPSGGTSGIPGSMTETFLDKIKNGLFSLGISIKDGVATVKDLVVEKFSAKTARFEKIEMVDKANGDAYCTWIENGEWQKAKGECGSTQVAVTASQQAQQNNVDTQKIVQQVKQDLQPQIQSQVQDQVQSQLQAQVPPPSVPEPQTLPPQDTLSTENEVAPESTNTSSETLEILPSEPTIPPLDITVQGAASALIVGGGEFVQWFTNLVTPASIQESSAVVSMGMQNILPVAIQLGEVLLQTDQHVKVAVRANTENNSQIVSSMAEKSAAGMLQAGQSLSGAVIVGIKLWIYPVNQSLVDIFESANNFGLSHEYYGSLYPKMTDMMSSIFTRTSLSLGTFAENTILSFGGHFQLAVASVFEPVKFILGDSLRLLEESNPIR